MRKSDIKMSGGRFRSQSENFTLPNTFGHALIYLPALTLSWDARCSPHSSNRPCTRTLISKASPRLVQCTICTTEHLLGLPLTDQVFVVFFCLSKWNVSITGNSGSIEKPSDKKSQLLINNPTYDVNMLVCFLPDFFSLHIYFWLFTSYISVLCF